MLMKKIKISTQSVILGLFMLPTALLMAAEKVDREIDLSGNPKIKFFNLRGSVEIKGWDKKILHIKGVLDEESTGLVLEEKGEVFIVKVKMPRRISPKKGSKLVIFVPIKSTVRALGVNSSWDVQGVADISINSVSGEIIVASSSGDVELEVVSAPVTVKTVAGSLDVNSLSGIITVADIEGAVSLSTVEGELKFTQPIINSARLNSVNGTIFVNGELSKHGNLSVTSIDGDVFLKVGTSTDLNCDLKALHGGKIINYLDVAGTESKQFMGKHFSLIIGDGEAKVEATTISGTIHLQD